MIRRSIAILFALIQVAGSAAGQAAGSAAGSAAGQAAGSAASSAADQGPRDKGVITVSAAFLRVGPDYETSLETQELMGVAVDILDSQSYWLKVHTPQPYDAWVAKMSVKVMTPDEFAAWETSPKYICTALHSAVLSNPCKGAAQVCDLVCGDVFQQCGGAKKNGFVRVALPDGRSGWVDVKDVEDYSSWQAERQALSPARKIQTAIAFAQNLMGLPYMWGGMSSYGVDCSGLTRLSYLMAGISLPRNASQQARCGREIAFTADAASLKTDLLPGDLIFFGKAPDRISHVGMYIGEGRFIHSSYMVRINSLCPEAPDFYGNLSRLMAVRRIAE